MTSFLGMSSKYDKTSKRADDCQLPSTKGILLNIWVLLGVSIVKYVGTIRGVYW